MQKLLITKTEWRGDTSHYLYQQTPGIVKVKILEFIASGGKPSITAADEKKYGKFIYGADVMLYPTKKKWSQAMLVYGELTNAITVLAFVPYGVEIFGYRYEVVDSVSS